MRDNLAGRHFVIKGARELLRADVPPARARYLESRCRRTASGCLVWHGAVNADGYGVLRIGSRLVYVHRLVIALALGACPADRVADHKCGVRACVELEHLRLVRPEENTPGIYGQAVPA